MKVTVEHEGDTWVPLNQFKAFKGLFKVIDGAKNERYFIFISNSNGFEKVGDATYPINCNTFSMSDWKIKQIKGKVTLDFTE